MTTPTDIISLIGKPHIDSSVRAVLEDLGLGDVKIRLKRGDFDTNLVAPKEIGVEIEFSDPANYNIGDSFPDGALIVSAVLLSPESQQAIGDPPDGIRFDMSRQEFTSSFGVPAWTSPVAPIDRWRLAHNDLTVRFDRATLKVTMIIFSISE